MATVKTQGIVIKKRNLGEADKILIIFTRDLGKISAVAKGVRRPISKVGGHLDLFCVSDLVLAEGRNLYTITSAELRQCFLSLRNKLKHTSQAFLMAEILDKIIHEKEKNEKIYYLFIECLKNLDDNNLILPYFELKLVILSGFQPHFEECVVCQKALKESKNYFSPALGGTVCENCAKIHRDLIPLSNRAIKILRFIAAHELKAVLRLKIVDEEVDEIEKLLKNYLEHILEGELKANRFLKKI